jgi:hypothetical protein
VKAVPSSTPGPSSERLSCRNCSLISSHHRFSPSRLTLGTTSLNQGVADKSSANQSAVADPRSFFRLKISHSSALLVRVETRECPDHFGNERLLRDDFLPDSRVVPRCSYRIQRIECLEGTPACNWHPVCKFSGPNNNGNLRAYGLPMAKHIRCRSLQAYALLPQRYCSLDFLIVGKPWSAQQLRPCS